MTRAPAPRLIVDIEHLLVDDVLHAHDVPRFVAALERELAGVAPPRHASAPRRALRIVEPIGRHEASPVALARRVAALVAEVVGS